jgi:TctA family transporter
MVLLFGVIGYLFNKLDYPLAPLVLAMVLGHKAEDAFHQSMILADGSLGVFWSNPLVGTIVTVALLLALGPQVIKLIARLRRRAERAPAE